MATNNELKALRAIGNFYGVTCTGFEARGEVLNLQRKAEKGTRDDRQERLSAELEIELGAPLAEIAKDAYRNWAAHIETDRT